jgi:hypothetical protein
MAELGITELTDETQNRSQVVDAYIVLDVNPVFTQQLPQERHLDRLLLEHVDDMLVQVARADAVVAGVMKPVTAAQLGRQVGFSDTRHTDQGNALVVPGAEFFDAEFQDWLR